jgi:hypothetical protein
MVCTQPRWRTFHSLQNYPVQFEKTIVFGGQKSDMYSRRVGGQFIELRPPTGTLPLYMEHW